uniref:Coiled-coil-helix-coiled-coil-helix domain-containing protein 7 n=1 Tax=Timema tahoe TaxID=61484 RepID=A0A7R9FJK1_9NEOP|nr:unnamed protein product [Timema tahoe]
MISRSLETGIVPDNMKIAKEHKMSLKCLDDSNYDSEKCSVYFANYKVCKQFWGDVKADRRNKGIVPALPLPEDRARVKEEFLEKRRQEKEIALEKRLFIGGCMALGHILASDEDIVVRIMVGCTEEQLPPGCRATLFDKLNHLAGSLEGSVRGNPRDASKISLDKYTGLRWQLFFLRESSSFSYSSASQLLSFTLYSVTRLFLGLSGVHRGKGSSVSLEQWGKMVGKYSMTNEAIISQSETALASTPTHNIERMTLRGQGDTRDITWRLFPQFLAPAQRPQLGDKRKGSHGIPSLLSSFLANLNDEHCSVFTCVEDPYKTLISW